MNGERAVLRLGLAVLALEIIAPTLFEAAKPIKASADLDIIRTAEHQIVEYTETSSADFATVPFICSVSHARGKANKILAERENDLENANKAEKRNERYMSVEMSGEETELLARIIWLEARGESEQGQQAVAEVVLNRVLSNQFPDTVYEVLSQGNPTQFTTWAYRDSAKPTETQYDMIHNALYGETVLDEDVVFFATRAENKNVWGTIGGHTFCRAYKR